MKRLIITEVHETELGEIHLEREATIWEHVKWFFAWLGSFIPQEIPDPTDD